MFLSSSIIEVRGDIDHGYRRRVHTTQTQYADTQSYQRKLRRGIYEWDVAATLPKAKMDVSLYEDKRIRKLMEGINLRRMF